MTNEMSSLTRELHDVVAPLEAEEERRAIAGAFASRQATRETVVVNWRSTSPGAGVSGLTVACGCSSQRPQSASCARSSWTGTAR
jgi:hypothetical protein